MSERLYIEETHHKLHEETEQEIISDLLDEDEERCTVREETAMLVGKYTTHKAMEAALKLEKNNE